MSTVRFRWPDGVRAALSLTFDDARPSQLEHGVPVLDAHGVRATFYVSPPNVERRVEAWRAVAETGHEIGNHSMHHPCSLNLGWEPERALELYTLERMEAEITDADAFIERRLGVKPATFAYPCGQTFVGRGEDTRSTVPLVARHFLAGRGYLGERHNLPAVCDLAHIAASGADRVCLGALRTLIDSAVASGGWLVLCSHDVGMEDRHQMMRREVLESLCRLVRSEGEGLWIDTVAAIAAHVAAQQRKREA
jgi:peptidoglycan/xylan/chitin deacetylase (PgdA/CDA1 family)